MLQNAPKFYEVAKRILEITNGCTLVAHNAQFDHRILHLEFDRLGYEFNIPTLCTVELAKDILPGHESYSLGKLVKSLGIPLLKRHRADGDAQATVKLFKLLLAKDTEKKIITAAVKSFPKKRMDTKLKDLIAEVPSETGVYYLHNINGTIIYIGKSKNIKKRLTQHFLSDNRKGKQLQDEVYAVSFEKTGNELIALLKENEEIKRNRPKYNRALRRTKFKVQLTPYIDAQGYLNLKTESTKSESRSITTFSNRMSAKAHLERIIETYNLCQNKTIYPEKSGACFKYSLQKCNGACIEREDVATYNDRVQCFIDKHSYQNQSMLIIDRGRRSGERSLVLVENGIFKGIGYYDLSLQINNLKILKSIIIPMEDNRDAKHIIQSYTRRKKNLKVIPLEEILQS